MRTILFVLCLLWTYFSTYAQKQLQSVNAILNDESYVVLFGTPPSENTSEKLRLQTHLLYVEALLRCADVSSLSAEQLQKRGYALDLLHTYTIKGIFPTNRVYTNERRPCFIDEKGNICAVGFLIEQTAGRELAEEINAKHQYDFLLDMNDSSINNWAHEYGFALEECAMIQPAYGPPLPPQQINADVKVGYGISSGIIGGTNIALIAAGLSPQYSNNKTLSCLGIATGTVQLVMGLSNTRKATVYQVGTGSEITTYYKAQNNLSYANITAGTATVITSAFNLWLHKKTIPSKNSVNLFSFPDSRSVAMGVAFCRQL